MKLNEVVKTGVFKHNGKTYDVFQTVKSDGSKLFTESALIPRGQKEKKHSKKLLESLASIGERAMASLELYANVKETNPPVETINLMTANLNESLHSMLLDYIAEIDSYNRKQEKLANPYLYHVTEEELEIFTEI